MYRFSKLIKYKIMTKTAIKQLIKRISKSNISSYQLENDMDVTVHVVKNLMRIDSRLNGNHLWVVEQEPCCVLTGNNIFRLFENEELFRFGCYVFHH